MGRLILVFFFQNVLVILVLLHFHVNLRIGLSFSAKYIAEIFNGDCIEFRAFIISTRYLWGLIS